MALRLPGKKAVIVGGASDMAQAANRIFLEEGADLFLIDFNETALREFKESEPEYAGRIHLYPADVTSPEQIEKAFQTAEEVMGRIDILVNIAGIIRHHPITEMSYEDWNAVLRVNLTGYFHTCKNAVPYMKAQRYGRIVNIASIGGRTGRPGCGCNYSASKAGVVGLTQALAKELAPWSITVNAVAPGPLKGKMFYSMTKEQQEKLEEGIPLGELGEMDQVAYAILFLASDEASYATGEVFDINGGLYI
jgi:NAD(P)-dependent dehydrogenase (short-subunit alcohol dehydrogenase family)